jgi:hypothetical protein
MIQQALHADDQQDRVPPNDLSFRMEALNCGIAGNRRISII